MLHKTSQFDDEAVILWSAEEALLACVLARFLFFIPRRRPLGVELNWRHLRLSWRYTELVTQRHRMVGSFLAQHF